MATVNESPTDKLIRELREENAKLMEMLKKGGVPPEMLGGEDSSGGGGDAASAEGLCLPNVIGVVFCLLSVCFI